MKTLIIGTAGHIDHGKTSLIKALNGFEGDTLKEEKERQITLKLSFSNLSRGGVNLAFIDVPGHKDLLKTMISGAFGFNASLFVVDINEGLRAQSLEHLMVLQILGVRRIILVLSKCDLCENLKQKSEEILEQMGALKMEPCKIFHTSTLTKMGIEDLKEFLFGLPFGLALQGLDEGQIFRLYIDRVFSLKGVGTIVTGSLNEGEIIRGEKIICPDSGEEMRVKNIQSFEKNLSHIRAPGRVALNLNCDYKKLQAGFLLSKKGFFRGFLECDVLLYAKDVRDQKFIFCVGSRQLETELRVLEKCADGEFFAHLRFKKKLFLGFNEAFILLENGRVFCGGRVLNPVSEPLKRDKKIKLLGLLREKNFPAAFDLLKNAHKRGFGLLSSYQRFGLKHEKALELAKNLKGAFVDEKGLNVYALDALDVLQKWVDSVLAKNPHAMIAPQSMSLRIPWASEGLCGFALKRMDLACERGVYFKKGLNLQSLQDEGLAKLYEILKNQALTPDAPYNLYENLELDRKSGDVLLKKLTKKGLVVRLTHNLFVEKSALENLKQELLLWLEKQSLDVQILKQKFRLSRKYAIAYLEYLDLDERVVKIKDSRFLKAKI